MPCEFTGFFGGVQVTTPSSGGNKAVQEDVDACNGKAAKNNKS
jgi:hypothetical protein